MTKFRYRTAVSPLRRVQTHNVSNGPARMDALIAAVDPVEPIYCLRPRTLQAGAARFVSSFPGDVLYAVKCNPEPAVLRAIWRGGVRHFDCASLAEIRLVRQMFPAATIHYMHPIKPVTAIAEAYRDHGVRNFSLDAAEEITKIVTATDGAKDLGLFIRLALPKGDAKHDLSGKFGASHSDAVRLLRRAREHAATLGICFHVGSQCLDPAAYETALELGARIVAESGVAIDAVDVGGGFPVSYPGETPPALDLYFAAIERGFGGVFGPQVKLMCEPGRAMVAAGASVLVRVEARRGNVLHINDGVYGSLADAGALIGLRYPARLIRKGEAVEAQSLLAEAGIEQEMAAFAFYGPTCDSADYMAGPFDLPANVQAGDYIELGQLGAYGPCLRTGFNGFDRMLYAEVTDAPLLVTPGHDLPKRKRRVRMAASGPTRPAANDPANDDDTVVRKSGTGKRPAAQARAA